MRKPPVNGWKKGQSGNPSGRPKTPKDVLEAKNLNKIKFTTLLNKFSTMTFAEIKAKAEDPNCEALEMIVCRVMIAAMKNGDHLRLNFILDRMIGKVADIVEMDAEIKTDVVYKTEWGALPGKKEE